MGNFLAYGWAPATLVAPLGSFSVVSNAILVRIAIAGMPSYISHPGGDRHSWHSVQYKPFWWGLLLLACRPIQAVLVGIAIAGIPSNTSRSGGDCYC